jgi:hypothetical protein
MRFANGLVIAASIGIAASLLAPSANAGVVVGISLPVPVVAPVVTPVVAPAVVEPAATVYVDPWIGLYGPCCYYGGYRHFYGGYHGVVRGGYHGAVHGVAHGGGRRR